MSHRIDLHTHSYYSDGSLSPADVVKMSAGKGVELLVLSDHDTVAGCGEALSAGEAFRIKVRPGIELNTREDDNVHILGYGIDYESPALRSYLEEFQRERAERVKKVVEKLQRLGVDVCFEEAQDPRTKSLGRPHVADALKRKGIVRSRREAFRRYLAKGKGAYVPSVGPTIRDAITIIREAGGVSCLAHPGIVGNGAPDLEKMVDWGLGAIEVYYPAHSPSLVLSLLEKARKYSLIPTGGSDFHGPGSTREESGGVEVPEEVYAAIYQGVG